LQATHLDMLFAKHAVRMLPSHVTTLICHAWLVALVPRLLIFHYT